MRGCPVRGKRISILRLLCVLACASAAPAAARSPEPPLAIDLVWTSEGLRWTLRAHADVEVRGGSFRFVPGGAESPFPAILLAAGERRSGRLQPPVAYVELRLVVRGPAGEMALGASARRPPAHVSEVEEIATPAATTKPAATRGAHRLLATFLYEDRLLDARGYSGQVQQLPVRHVAAELVDAARGVALARARTDAEGRLVLAPLPAAGESVLVALASTTLDHPDWNVAVLEPGSGPDPRASARPHVLRTAPVRTGDGDLDLGTIVLRDPDGFGRLQAFHVLDVVLDAWEALGSNTFPGPRPGRAESLRVYWGPTQRIRVTASAEHEIEIASPGSGDTDGWSDAVVLHEVGHFVAQRFLRDSSPGGLHILGDVEQEPRLAWSEALSTSFACWVRAHRAEARRNAAGEPADSDVARFVNAGMPPPDGTPGGLQYAWDVENHLLGTTPLAREGIGSETNLAGLLWDLVDDAAAPDAEGGDDEAVYVPAAAAWSALRALRALPAGAPITFEAFWDAWQRDASDPGATVLRPLLEAGRIEFAPDGAEPDLPRPPQLWVARTEEPPGGVVLSEILPGPQIAVEIVNRAAEPRELAGWMLVARSNGSSGAPSLTFTLPAGTLLGPGARLVVWRGGPARASTPRWLYADGWTAPWFPEQEGALSLLDAAGLGVDFVRWNARNGTASTTTPPAGTGWSGDLATPGFGRSLGRDVHRADGDVAADFAALSPSLGAPNDVPGVHRTFFPEHDEDVLAWRIEAEGAYTFAARRVRDGARLRVELRLPGRRTPLAVVIPGAPEPLATLRLAAGDEVQAWIEHAGSVTRFGVYDVALWAEPDARLLLPPTGLETAVALGPASGEVRLAWWNAALYDSLGARGAGGPWTVLAGDARSWSLALPRGRHRVELVAHVRGRAAPAPALLVAVEEWPDTLRDDFETLDTDVWERSGAWDTLAAPGRPGRVLADSPAGRYADNVVAAVRLRPAVGVLGASVLEFDHVCIVRSEDTAELEASADWGARWEALARWDWNAHRGVGEAANWRDGRADSLDWVHEAIPLERFAGRPVQLRFTLTTDIYGGADGWFLDALRVAPRTALPVPPALAARLLPNVPNPFNPSTLVRFELARPAEVVLRVLDVRGRVVRLLFAGPAAAGPHGVPWDGSDGRGRPAAGGVYLCDLQAGPERASRKLVLVH